MDIAALKSLLVQLPKSAAPREDWRAQRVAARRQAALRAMQERRERSRARKEEADAFRHACELDHLHALGLPPTRLSLYLLRNFTPVHLQSGRLVWLQMLKLYPFIRKA